MESVKPPLSQDIAVQRVQGRVRYLLIGAALVTLIHPMSESGFVPAIVYLVLFCLFFGFGVTFIAVNRRWVWLAIASAIWQTVLGVLYLAQMYGIGEQAQPPSTILTLLLFGGFIVFDAVIMYVLLEYIFVEVKRMSNAVIYTAITVYILIGYMFAPAYMCIETITLATTGTHAFAILSTPDAPLHWQRFVYYSFVTVTTLGYGDIVPVSSWAQAFAGLEAALGVLYIAILIGRLVGLNSASSSASG